MSDIEKQEIVPMVCPLVQAPTLSGASNETWIARNWRPSAAVVYLAICLFDFMLMPVYYEWVNRKLTPFQQAEIARGFEGGASQVEAMRMLRLDHKWEPLTLKESGLFHVAFGAILGAAAWSRGREKIERMREETPRLPKPRDLEE